MPIPGEIRRQLSRALVAAFNEAALRRCVRDHLDERLDTVVGAGTLRDKVDDLLDWAERQGRIEELVEAAAAEVAGNTQLQEACAAFRAFLGEQKAPTKKGVRAEVPSLPSSGDDAETGFHVFLSHNSRDKPAVRALGEALRERGLRAWLDEWELVPGRPWQEALEEIIEAVPCTAVLVGGDGLGPWEVPEMRAALAQFVGRGMPVIPVLLPDAPATPELPLFLQQFTWVDLRGGLTDAGLDRLEWGITGRKPSRSAGR